MPIIDRDGQRHVAHAMPLISGTRRRAGVAYSAVAALFVRRAALTIPPRSEVIGKAFRLTPAELRVMLAIVELGGVPEVAAALGVALKNYSIVGVFAGAWAEKFPHESAHMNDTLIQLLADGQIRPHIDRILPLRRSATPCAPWLAERFRGELFSRSGRVRQRRRENR